jgi:tryptophan synthase alpha subunit
VTAPALLDVVAGNAARGELAVGMYLVPGFPDWRTSIEALGLCLAHGVDFVEFPAMSAARWSARTGPMIARALADAEPYSESEATAWLLRAPVRVAVVYESAWPSPATWAAPASLRTGVCGYLFESDPPDVTPYALAASADGAVIIPAVDASTAGLSDADQRVISCGGGFVYGSLGPMSGARTATFVDLRRKSSGIRGVRRGLPVCAAFGISEPADVEGFRDHGYCEGVIIGSAALARLGEGIDAFGAWLKDIVTAAK